MSSPEQPGPALEHVGRVVLSPRRHIGVNFNLTDEAGETLSVQAVLRDPDQQIEGSDQVLAVSAFQDSQGNPIEYYLKLPRHIMESREARVVLYNSPEELTEGIGGLVVDGVVGGLHVRRFPRRHS